ncbi:hypothetical protein [Lentzea sp. E54]|uniref:hypothetical protein n=1 Tax=Lentzea xerophila TaxID=3435883 RepID=UPI003DA31BC0
MTAAISGPGAFSQRTDAPGQPIRDLPNPEYGEATAFRDQQKAAPLSQAPGIPRMETPPPSAGMAAPSSAPTGPLPPLFAPSQRPDEPITAGVPFGPGPSSIGTERAPEAYQTSTQLREYANADPTGALAWLANMLQSQGQ